MTWLSGHGLEKKNIGELVAKRLGAHLMEWLQSVRIFLFCVMSTKWQPQQTRLSVIMWTRQLFAQPSHSLLKRTDEASSHRGRLGDYSWAQQHGPQLTVDDVAVSTGEYPTHQQQKVTLSHQYGNISQANKPATWWQFDYIQSLLSQKGKQFVLFGIDTYSGDGFAFTANNNPAKNTIHFGDCSTRC